MTWPIWLSAPESFAIGLMVGFVLAAVLFVAWLDRHRARLEHESRDRALFEAIHGSQRPPLVIVRKQIHL